MEVILLERIHKLGQMGDVVSVKPGYARNFLLPKGKALRATKGNMERFERERAQLEARNLELKTEAEAVLQKLEGESFVAIRQAGDTGQLYGSVTTRDVADMMTEGGFSVLRNQVLLERPIKDLGVHTVRISLHPEVETHVIVNVARSAEEAERQAQGEDVLATEAEEEAAEAVAAQEFFEEEVLAEGLDLEEAEEEISESETAPEAEPDAEPVAKTAEEEEKPE